jgi:hypothetical protein
MSIAVLVEPRPGGVYLINVIGARFGLVSPDGGARRG